MTSMTCPNCEEESPVLDGKVTCYRCGARIHVIPPRLDGPEPVLSRADQEALDRLECQACHLPGMRDGVCLFGHLHKSSDQRNEKKS